MDHANIFFGGWVGGYEWIIIVIVILLLFGGRKIPELMKGLGQGLKEFKSAKDGKEKTYNKDSEKDSTNSK